MPICPKCNAAYVPGETHVCRSRTSRIETVVGVLVGALLGAAVGFFVVAAISCHVFDFGAQCGLVGVSIGMPLGILAGGFAGAQVARSGSSHS